MVRSFPVSSLEILGINFSRLPDASVDPAAVAADVKAVGSIGAGGIEFLPFYGVGKFQTNPLTCTNMKTTSMEVQLERLSQIGPNMDTELQLTTWY